MTALYDPVKYVIFDMDGLLLDTERIYFQTYEKVLAKYGHEYTKEIQLSVMGRVPRETYTYFVQEFHLPMSPEELEDEMNKELHIAGQFAPLMPGAEKLIKHFHKNSVPIAVATSNGKDMVASVTKNHQELFKLFHHKVMGNTDPEVKRGKPAPDIFLICASRFPEKPEPREVLVFEDAPNGVLAARAAGMQVVMVPDPMVPEEKRQSATKVLNSLEEFKPEEFGLPEYE